MSKALFVGIDVAKAKLDISFTCDGVKYDTLSIFNNEKSILGFFDYLQNTFKNHVFFFGYEATSNYMHVLQKLLTTNKFKQIMINPYMMSHYLKHLNSRTKSDLADSQGIAKFIRIDWFCVHSIEKVNPSGAFERDLYDLEICFDSAIVLEDFSVDFSPLLKAFRIKSSSIQVHNIRDFCRLFAIPEIVSPLGELVVRNFEQIKTYLKLLTSAFGGKGKVLDDNDLNINLKTLCELVGVPTSDGGLKGDELSNMYIKRISVMLGVKNA